MRAIVLMLALGTAGCAHPSLSPEALPTRETLVHDVVDALGRGDRERLVKLAVSDSEFRELIWPRLPASRPAVGMPVEYLWADTSAKSRGHLSQTLARYGGRAWRVDALIPGRAPVDYGTFRVHSGASVRLRGDDGTLVTTQVFGSLIEQGHAWKVFSYVVD